MKNIFKMMLVAVAAISLAACSAEQEMGVEVNTQKTTTVKLCMGFDATRSKFNGTNDAGTAYVSTFDGTESFHYYHKAPQSSDALGNVIYNDKSGIIRPELSGDVIYPEIELNDIFGGTFRICSPSTSAVAGNGGFTLAIPQQQTPLAESCDPKAHVLYGEYTWSGDLTYDMPIMMQHHGAYGRMTLNGLDEVMLEGETIKNVIVNIDNTNYILNPENVVNNVFWFACYQYLNPTLVTVSVNTMNGEEVGRSYVKTLNIAGKNFSFEQGKVTQFKVGMNKDINIEEAPVVVAEHILTTVSYNASTGRFEFSNDHGDFLYMYLNKEDRPDNNSIKPGVYKWSDTAQPAEGFFRINRFNFDGQDYTTFGDFVNTETATMEVTINEDGRYIITIYYELGYSADFKIRYDIGYSEQNDEDLEPYREQLAKPEVETSIESGNVIVTWNKVANANDYKVEIWGDGGNVNEVVEQVGDVDNYTFAGLELVDGKEYTIKVTALDTTLSYRTSEYTETKVTYSAAGGGEGGGNEGGGETGSTVDMTGCTTTVSMAGSFLHLGLKMTKGDVTLYGVLSRSGMSVIGTYTVVDGTDKTAMTFNNVTVNGTDANNPTGTVVVSGYGPFTVSLNIEIDGVKYTGTTSFEM